MRIVGTETASEMPLWRRPVALLFVFAFAMPIAFNTWSALLNNFVIEAAGFTGVEIGWLHTVREIPGFLAVGVIALIIFMREQVTWNRGAFHAGCGHGRDRMVSRHSTGLLTVTMLSSIGFHYFETVNQSLQLQWIDKPRAPQMLGLDRRHRVRRVAACPTACWS